MVINGNQWQSMVINGNQWVINVPIVAQRSPKLTMVYVAALVRVEGVKGGRDTRGHWVGVVTPWAAHLWGEGCGRRREHSHACRVVGVVTPWAAHHARLDISDELGEFGEVELAIWGVIIPAHHRLRSQSTPISGESTGVPQAINGQSTDTQQAINRQSTDNQWHSPAPLCRSARNQRQSMGNQRHSTALTCAPSTVRSLSP